MRAAASRAASMLKAHTHYVRPALAAGRPPPAAGRRSLSSRRAAGGGEKSWGEIADEVKEVAMDVGGKLKAGAERALSAILPSPAAPPAAPRRRTPEEEGRLDLDRAPGGGGGVGGLLGGMVGGLLGRAVGAAVEGLGKQVREMAGDRDAVYAAAARRIAASGRLRAALGSAPSAGPPVSVSSSSSSINGRASKSLVLVLPIADAAGRVVAQAQARGISLSLAAAAAAAAARALSLLFCAAGRSPADSGRRQLPNPTHCPPTGRLR